MVGTIGGPSLRRLTLGARAESGARPRRGDRMTEDRIVATYLVETPFSLEHAAQKIAGVQSSSTFVAVPGETEALRERVGARVERLEALETVDVPALRGAKRPAAGDGYTRGIVALSIPFDNVGPNLPTILSTIMGSLFELSELSGVRLIDVEWPAPMAQRYPGPQFGVTGTRAQAGVHGRPILGTIIKPPVGLTPQETAEMVGRVAEAGIDFVKDDEIQANSPRSPLAERVVAVMRVVNDFAQRTGKKPMIAFNISDELDAMLRHHDTVLAHGGTCVLVSINSVGPVGVSALRRHSQLPIHGHRNGWGLWTRHPFLGIDFMAYQKLWRLVGVDQLHVNGLANKFWEPDESVLRSIGACLTPMLGGYTVMPVIGSGQTVRQVFATFERSQTTDVIYLAGGGIMGHPGGAAAGVTALRQAWDAAMAGVRLEAYAESHTELSEALATFGAPL
jgi:ribulose-bisphosphate carboxylase large chain